ncbi:MAG: S8 family serine peptidase, partial [Firmicutes bacterium]|nr:S8 family serine peptidase [Bacillota bacterium]
MKRMKITALITILTMAFTVMPAVSYGQEADAEEQASSDQELIIVYEKDAECTDSVTTEDLMTAEGESSEEAEAAAADCSEQIAEETGVEVEKSEFISAASGDDGAALTVKLEEGADIDEAIGILSENPDIAYVQKNYEYTLLDDVKSDMGVTINDAYQGEQYYLGAWKNSFNSDNGTNVIKAWDEAKTNGAVSVAVIDTGVMTNHVDLKDNIDMDNALDATETGDISRDVEDYVGHGTHVAGIIAATANNDYGIAGVSYNANIIPVKVTDTESNIKTSYVVRAYEYIKYLIKEGKVDNLHVINMSMGSYGYSSNDLILKSSISELRSKYNVITVCAGGNGDGKGHPKTAKVYPGDFDECLCVTALDSFGNNAVWSDYNEYKDISAPGEDILSTFPGSEDEDEGSYGWGDGTSFAAPQVSGIMALLWSVKPQLTVKEATAAVIGTVNPVGTAINDRGTKTGSAGAIDALASVKCVKYGASSVGKNISLFKAKSTISKTSYVYNGSARKPAVSVVGLKKGTSYTVSYKNNTKVGTATATITGTGAYKGTITKT